MDAACDLKPLCGAHVAAHRQWGHGVAVLVEAAPSDVDAPAPDTVLGVTHCPLPEHAGPPGLYTLWCKSCRDLICQACVPQHVDQGHTLLSVSKASSAAGDTITDALPVLQAGLAHQASIIAQARAGFDSLASNRTTVMAALAAHTARLHAQVDAQHAVALTELDAVHEAKVAALEAALKAARSCAAELATVVAVAAAALESSCPSTTRLHASKTVAASLVLAKRRDAVGVGATVEMQGGKDLTPDCFPKVLPVGGRKVEKAVVRAEENLHGGGGSNQRLTFQPQQVLACAGYVWLCAEYVWCVNACERMWVDACGCVWMRVDACGCVWMRVDACGCVWMRVDACGCVWMRVDACGCVWMRVCGCVSAECQGITRYCLHSHTL